MKINRIGILSLSLACLFSCNSTPSLPPIKTEIALNQKAESWITHADRTKVLSKSASLSFSSTPSGSDPVILLDTATQYQSLDGFGFTLTGGSAKSIQGKLSEADRSQLLKELFLTTDNGIGISYLRVSIGASDLDDHVFSYDDVPSGQKDLTLEKFSLNEDKKYLIPLLKQIIALNPQIKIMGSPWSAPAWMKTNQSPKGGSLKQEYYKVYADYFVKYIQGMKAEGINIDAITIQNEPEHPGNMPSMTMTASEQIEFVKSNLGPAFTREGIKTKIIIYDHNCDHPEYPLSVLNDPQAKSFIDGTAFHMYLGDISALNKVYNAHPDKNIYFTEQWTSGEGNFGGDLAWHVKNLIIGATRNRSRVVLEWNLAADEKFEPHTSDGGCTLCLGGITVNSATSVVTRNVSYYIIGHASKFVPPGSVRIFSSETDGLPNVAFYTPAGKKVLIVLNDGKTEKNFSIKHKSAYAPTSLPAGAVATYVF